MDSVFNLSSKTFLVTGASSGIGKQIAITLSIQGANVILFGRNRDRLEETFSMLKNGTHKIVMVDINDHLTVNNTVDHLPELDGIVHSAGILKQSPMRVLESSAAEEIMRTNYFAPVNLTQCLLNKKKLKGGSSVVFISSVNGPFIAVKTFGAYAASKAALNSISKIFALEYASKKIRFNTINPGMIKTEMMEKMELLMTKDALDSDKKKYPLGDYGDPEDVAYACLYLLSNASKWVTGTSIVIDGGLTIG